MSDKILVVYYSRTGMTAKIAKEISARVGADMEEVIDKKNRKGLLGWLSAGRDAGARKLTEIGESKRDPSLYGLVVIGTPVWNSNISTPIRTYITRYKDKFQDVALFCTGSAEDHKVLGDMEALIGKKPLASLKLRRKQEIEAGEYSQKVRGFIEQFQGKRG
jgi:flavodoxin